LGRRRVGLVFGVCFLLLVAVFGVVLNVRVVWGSGTIYIRADGSIDPPTAPITSADNVIYTFTDNIYDSIVVERDNVIVDGVGYTVHGTGSENGIDLAKRKNVTVRNVDIKEFEYGIWLHDSFNNSIVGNNITYNSYGVLLWHSSNNSIFGNSLTTNKWFGIYLSESSNNAISGNNITNNEYGIRLWHSSSNIISRNKITANNLDGIRLIYSSNDTVSGNKIANNGWFGINLEYSSSNNVSGNIFNGDGIFVFDSYLNVVEGNVVNGKPLVYLEGVSGYIVDNAGQVILVNSSNIKVENLDFSNTTIGIQLCKTNKTKITNNRIANNAYGIYLYKSSNNSISGSNVTNNRLGITLDHSSDNTITGNKIANNWDGIPLVYSSNNTVTGNTFVNNGLYVWDSYGNFVEDNVVNGKPLVYLERVSNYTVSYAGQVLLIDCDNITVEGLNLSHATVGVQLWNTKNTKIANNNMTANNRVGIYLSWGSSNNTVSGNSITNNYDGIWLRWSSGNKIYHNNFINNTRQVDSEGSINVWDDGYPSGGNYWSDYTGVDEKSGPNQDQLGSDGIGDTPYIIDANNQDLYPFMSPLDLMPPTTIHDYDDLWHTTSFIISLTATDDMSGVAETCYRINDGSTKTVSPDGQPLITTEGANNKLEYWSVDNAGNEELPHKILTEIKLDKTAPTIGIPSRTPDEDILPEQEVKVSVSVNDVVSGVKSVTLSYTINDGTTWTNLPMNYNPSTTLYEATIPKQRAGTWVKYKIVAQDNAENQATKDGADPYCIYQVIPEFPTWTAILTALSILSATLILLTRKTHPHHHNHG